MREIKFRVWDNGAKMYQQMSAMMNVHTGHISDLPERHILEQFTGLHDKNGREIYEGDILKLHVEGSEDFVFEVSQFRTGFEFTDRDVGARLWEAAKNCKVIGNIHENPELIDDHSKHL